MEAYALSSNKVKPVEVKTEIFKVIIASKKEIDVILRYCPKLYPFYLLMYFVFLKGILDTFSNVADYIILHIKITV